MPRVLGFSGSRIIPTSAAQELAKDVGAYLYIEHRIHGDILVIHGGASGFDALVQAEVERQGRNFLLQVETCRPDYKMYRDRPKFAPIARNVDIARRSDEVIACWNQHPRSRGTLWTCGFALHYGKPLKMVLCGDRYRVLHGDEAASEARRAIDAAGLDIASAVRAAEQGAADA